MTKLALALLMSLAMTLSAAPRFVELPGDSPLVTFRLVFLAGAASDPKDKPGLAALTASMLANGGTKKMSYDEIVEAMFPMATSVSSQIGKEMTLRKNSFEPSDGRMQSMSNAVSVSALNLS